MNIRMEYLYRDAGNYKNWGEVVFANPNRVPVSDVEKLVAADLFERHYFLAESVGLPDLHFPDHNLELDHDWHEFHAFAETEKIPDDAQGRNVEQLIECLRSQRLL